MWKSFFYFSGSQRAGVLVLLCLILLVGLIDFFLPVFFPSDSGEENISFLAEIDDFKKSLVSIDSIKSAQGFRDFSSYDNSSRRFANNSFNETAVLFHFDPNGLDSSGFTALGLKSHVITNILKYRRKGGQFKDKESFSRIYGISEQKFQELSPYIQLLSHDNFQTDTITQNEDKVLQHLKVSVELNAADTTELMQIKGIGRAYANAIVRFRKQTGGFIHIDQLREIYGMSPENFNKIKPYCTIDRTMIQKIKVNTASVDKLKAHPYLNFYQAKQIYELRRKNGKLKSIVDLSKLSEFDDAALEKIAVYLNFD